MQVHIPSSKSGCCSHVSFRRVREWGRPGAGRAPPRPVCGGPCQAAWEEEGGEHLTLDNAVDERALEQGL